GQVAVLSSGAIGAREAAELIESLFASDLFRRDQSSFMLYPDRQLPWFLEKNRIPAEALDTIPLLRKLLLDGNEQLIVRDARGCHRFNSDFRNVGDLEAELAVLGEHYDVEPARQPLRSLFESVFDHQSFTGRSGTMFRFEGLGCIYWHMVSKLLLAVQESFFAAFDQGAPAPDTQRLGELYYRVRSGLGFNKTPAEYGAFPTDPYSHTPGQGGASQPGMTGQVKEEVLTRFGELGVRVCGGSARFEPSLLRIQEFNTRPQSFRYLDVHGFWHEIDVPQGSLAFTWCQVPIVYEVDAASAPAITVQFADGREHHRGGTALTHEESAALFQRDGSIRRLTVRIGPDQLFSESLLRGT
ncbi:MAG TPA: hypothetical protein VLT59_12585, partial [Steroidobacteraceae bacterium]|nr:hypothetical protein [Steroidobacteraceae bacterium]